MLMLRMQVLTTAPTPALEIFSMDIVLSFYACRKYAWSFFQLYTLEDLKWRAILNLQGFKDGVAKKLL